MNRSVWPANGLQLAVGGGRFQQADRRGADGHHPPAAPAAGQNPIDGLLLHASPFGVHPVLGQRVGGDGAKRAGADVQRQRAKLDALARPTASSSVVVKCSPAVGAATAPGTWA